MISSFGHDITWHGKTEEDESRETQEQGQDLIQRNRIVRLNSFETLWEQNNKEERG